MKKCFLAALLLTVTSGARAEVKNPDTFIYDQISDIDSLDPAWMYDTASGNIVSNIYEFLVAFKKGSAKDLVPMLATKVPSKANGLVSSDGLTYKFPIRKGVKFHDGTAMTPEDVRYSLLRFMLMDRDGGPSALLLQPILDLDSTRGKDGALVPGVYGRAAAAVTVQGDNVVVKLPKPFAPFMTILATWGGVVPEAWCKANGDWDGTAAGLVKFNNPAKREDLYLGEHENGTGPFKLSRWDRNNKEIILERFDGYWRPPAKLAHVIIRSVDEPNNAKLQIKNGDADEIYAPMYMRSQLNGLPDVVITEVWPMEAAQSLNFNFKINTVGNPYVGSGQLDGDGIPGDFFTDINVRKAFAYSFDYDTYIRDVLAGKGVHPAGFIPKGMLGYMADGPKYTFDPVKAAEYFKKARNGEIWDKGFRFTCLFVEASQPGKIQADMMKRNIEALNPKFKIDTLPLQWSSYLAASTAFKVPFIMGAWQADYPDPHDMAFPLMHSKGYYSASSGYSNPEADKLIERALVTLDPAKRDAMYKKLQKIVYDELPFMITDFGIRYRTERSWVKGWTFDPVFPDTPYGSYYYDLSKVDPDAAPATK